MIRIFQKGFNYGQDGPGNRLVYHLQGCNMRCRWCANPEGMERWGGMERTIEQLAAECESCRPLFFDGGGVTFTGGEPTLQLRELDALLTLLKGKGISTALETNGTSPELPRLLERVDHLMMDVKHFDMERLKEYTGMDGRTVTENLAYLCETGRPAVIRIPLIYEFNAQPEAFAAFFTQFHTQALRFELLPYHEYGREKWTQPYKITSGWVPPKLLERFRRVFAQKGLQLTET